MKTVLKLILLLLVLAGIYWFVFYKTPEQQLFERTLSAARAGDTQAAFEVAGLYASGRGTAAPNGNQAAEWYRKAAA